MRADGVYGLDFEPYRQEILELYINQRKTAAEATKYLQDTYKIPVTIDQFKHAFGHLKNIPKQRWTSEIIPTVAKRRLEGKESAVYFRGSRVEAKRVKRSLERYRGGVALDLSKAPIRVGSSVLDEVYIRSPSPNPLSPTAEQRDNISLLHSEQSINWSALPAAPHKFSTTQIDSLSFWLQYSLPVYQLYNAVRSNLFVGNIGQLRPLLSLSDTNLGNDRTPAAQLHPSATEKLCQVIGIPVPSESNTIETFAKAFRNTLPPGPWADDFTEKLPQHVAERLSYFQLFTVATFLASNKRIICSTEGLVDCISEDKFRHLLTALFKLRIPSVTALAEVLVDGAVRYQPKLIKLLAEAGAPSEWILRALGFAKHPEIVDFFASGFDLEILNEEEQTILLATAIATGKVDLVHSLILGKVNVNMNRQTNEYKICAPLVEAVKAQRLDLVQVLLENGANVNQRCKCFEYSYRNHSALSSAIKLENLKIIEYLLEYGAQICEGFEDIFRVNFIGLPLELCDALQRSEDKNFLSEIIYTAQSRDLLSDFLYYTRIPRDLAIKAFETLLARGEVESALNLLEIGLPRLKSSAFSCLIHVLEGKNRLTFSNVKTLLLTIYSQDISMISWPVMDSILWAQHYFLKEPWNISHRIAILDMLYARGYDFERFGPGAIEGALRSREWFDNPDLGQTIEALLRYGVPVNYYGNKMTPFQVAAYLGSLHLIEKMLSQGAILNREAFDYGGMTALQAAAHGKSLKTVQRLVVLGADIKAAPAIKRGLTALEAAIRPQILAVNGDYAYIDDPTFDNDTSEKIFTFLLDKEPNVLDLSNRPDSPLLQDLIYRGLFSLLEKVLSMGATQNHYFRVENDLPHYTPLQLACNLVDFEVIKLLLEYKAEVNQPAWKNNGKTALQAVISHEIESIDIVKHLIDSGADVNAPPAELGGVTALQAASIRCHFNTARLLLEKGADVNGAAAKQNGHTAIEGAAQHGRLDMVQLLLNAQAANNTVQRTELESAIRLAKRNRHLAVVGLIEDTLNAVCVG